MHIFSGKTKSLTRFAAKAVEWKANFSRTETGEAATQRNLLSVGNGFSALILCTIYRKLMRKCRAINSEISKLLLSSALAFK